MEIKLKRINNYFHFEAFNQDLMKVDIDSNPDLGGQGKGVRPMELVLMGLAGCASIDLGLILKKQHQVLLDYEVKVSGVRKNDAAKAFQSINIHFILVGDLNALKVEKAIALTLTKFCSVSLSLDKSINITSSFEIQQRNFSGEPKNLQEHL